MCRIGKGIFKIDAEMAKIYVFEAKADDTCKLTYRTPCKIRTDILCKKEIYSYVSGAMLCCSVRDLLNCGPPNVLSGMLDFKLL